mmetsp:Transcript_13460/g.29431  ORF Transcript_13460/g.29431 Transcript_13460/m.29431 type:complete len:327 (+) Transcript_13460:83-1063(+)
MGEESNKPALGFYVGHQSDLTCPGDNVTFEILLDRVSASIAVKSEMSQSKGGTMPWTVEGIWVWDEGDWEIVFTVTKADPLGGPQLDRDITLEVSEDLKTLIYRKEINCTWAKPPPDPIAERLAAMPLKELKETALASGLDPDGCIERGDFMRIISSARKMGNLKFVEGRSQDPGSPDNKSAQSPSPKATTSSSPKEAPASTSVPAAAAEAKKVEEAAAATTVATEEKEAAVKTEEAAPASTPEPKKETAAPAPAAPTTEAAEAGFYTLEQLTEKHIWEKLDVKANERETYLSPKDFEALFAMSKDDFTKLPKWKKENLKKKHNLF